jgi:hypothetical protein
MVMEYFINQMNNAGGKNDRLKRMLVLIAREGLEEMSDAGAPPEAIAFYFSRAANLTYWSATGDRVVNLPWPQDFDPPAALCLQPEAVAELPE